MPHIGYIVLGAFCVLVLLMMFVNLIRLFATHRKRATLCDDAWLTHSKKPQGRCSWHGGVAPDK